MKVLRCLLLRSAKTLRSEWRRKGSQTKVCATLESETLGRLALACGLFHHLPAERLQSRAMADRRLKKTKKPLARLVAGEGSGASLALFSQDS